MQTSIKLKNMRFYANHGVLPQEKITGNNFVVNVTFTADVSRSFETGDVADTVNYAAVYDLVKHQAVKFTADHENITIPVDVDAGDGKLFLILNRPIARLKIEAPPNVKRGQESHFSVTALDADGNVINALIPLQIEVRNAVGAITADNSCYAVTENGEYHHALTPALNAGAGKWTITAKDLAAGTTARQTLEVE